MSRQLTDPTGLRKRRPKKHEEAAPVPLPAGAKPAAGSDPSPVAGKKPRKARAASITADPGQEAAQDLAQAGPAPVWVRPEGLQITRRAVSSLVLDPSNVNLHDDHNKWAIRNSLLEFQQVEPLLVQKSTGRVIGGNGRLEVMRAEGVLEADVIELDIDDQRAMALAIALNRTAKTSQFDIQALSQQLQALDQDPKFNLQSVGFTAEEVDLIVREATGAFNEVLGQVKGPAAPAQAVNDPAAEWQGMPACENQDLVASTRAIIVHFASPEDVQAFAALVGQDIGEKTKFIWHRKREWDDNGSQRYVPESA